MHFLVMGQGTTRTETDQLSLPPLGHNHCNCGCMSTVKTTRPDRCQYFQGTKGIGLFRQRKMELSCKKVFMIHHKCMNKTFSRFIWCPFHTKSNCLKIAKIFHHSSLSPWFLCFSVRFLSSMFLKGSGQKINPLFYRKKCGTISSIIFTVHRSQIYWDTVRIFIFASLLISLLFHHILIVNTFNLILIY